MEIPNLTTQIKTSLCDSAKNNGNYRFSTTNSAAQKPKSKKAKIAAISLGSAALLGLATVLFQPRFFGKKATHFFSEYGQKIASNIKESKVAKKVTDKLLNIGNNFTSMKDFYVKKFTDKAKPLKWRKISLRLTQIFLQYQQELLP